MCALLHPPCPECESTNTRKHGHLLTRKGKFQRYQCMKCACTFTPRKIVDTGQKGIDQYNKPSESEVKSE